MTSSRLWILVTLVLCAIVCTGAHRHHSSRPGHHHAEQSEHGKCKHVVIEFDPSVSDVALAADKFGSDWSKEQFDSDEPLLVVLHPVHRHVQRSWVYNNTARLDPDTLSVHLLAEQKRRDSGRHGVLHFECQHPRRRRHRSTKPQPIDQLDEHHFILAMRGEPLWEKQWHLHDGNEVSDYWLHSGAAADYLSVLTAWRHQHVYGRNVTISIVDDGLDHMHAEFRESYVSALSWDYNSRDGDPEPYVRDSHGTEAAALACGRLNGVCGLGTAPLSNLAAVRLVADSVNDATEAHGLTHSDTEVDIYSCSWGPFDDGLRLDGPGPVTAAAMEVAVEQEGRNGRGVVYVWAAGNGRAWLDSCNYDGFANSRIVLPVSAVDFFSRDTYYSEWCASAALSAPSSGTRGPFESHRIATAQPHGQFGESSGDCTSSFGGTSASAPMVAGVVALVLEARPDLYWRQVQRILMQSAVRNDATHRSWQRNAAGHWHSPAYGFGAVNASAAVELARSIEYDLEEEQASYRVESVMANPDQFPLTIQDGFPFVDSVVELSLVSSQLRAEFVELLFTAQHPRRGELEVYLYSPAGTVAVLAQAHLDENADYDQWKFGARTFMDESAEGVWRLVVRDAIPSVHRGQILAAQLNIWGT